MSWDFSHDGPNQKFGWRPRKGGQWHYGRDYGTQGKDKVPLGVPKYCDGWVCHVVENNKIDGLGNQVVLIKPNGKEMVRFGHISSGTTSHLKNGQIMQTGDWIGNIGGVGYEEDSFAPHIHVEHGFNPKYEMVQTEHDGKQYQYKQWYCGDHKIEDYKDPNEKALPFSELEELTNMAFNSREAILSGNGRPVKMSKISPVDLVKQNPEDSSFSTWFKTSWFGRLLYSDETKKPLKESENSLPSERTGPIIHRKIPSSTNKDKTLQQNQTASVLHSYGQKIKDFSQTNSATDALVHNHNEIKER